MSGDWGMQNLEYVDILDGGTYFIRANGCINLKEIEADYIYLKETSNGKMIFQDCKKLLTVLTKVVSPKPLIGMAVVDSVSMS